MKRAALLMCAAMLLAALLPRQEAQAKGPATSAQAATLIDVQSGRILAGHHGDQRVRIASLTKIMTAIVAIENGNLSDKVKVGKNAYGKEGSSIYLKLGEEMSLEHLLYGLMLRSGNDAAAAIAEHVGGSIEGFVYLMNRKAEELGLTNSQFRNPHGLDQEGHYSSANDLARLTAYSLKNPTFRQIVKTKVKRVPNSTEDWDHVWYNKNKMLSFYDGADGVKTGYTKLARRCLVSSATRNGQQLAVVTINDPKDWADHKLLLDYGFRTYPSIELAPKGTPINGTNLMTAVSFRYPLKEDELSQVSKKLVVMPDSSTTAYRLGERGYMAIYLNRKEIGRIPLMDDPSAKQSASAYGYRDEAGNDSENYRFIQSLKLAFRSLCMGK